MKTIVNVLAVSLFLIAITCFAKSSVSMRPLNPLLHSISMPDAWDWTNEILSDDDSSYQKLRVSVDKLVKEQLLTPQRLRIFEQKALKRPLDAHAQFLWGYAVYSAHNAGFTVSDTKFLDVIWALSKPQPPKSYEYTRLHYLVMAKWQISPKLQIVGKRLIDKNSSDYDVKFYYIRILGLSLNAEDRQEALNLARSLVNAYPNRASAYGTLGRVYTDAWLLDHKPQDVDKAVEAFSNYIKLTPLKGLDAETRNDTKLLITILEKQKAQSAGTE